MFPYRYQMPSVDEDWANVPPQGKWVKWGGGLVVPIALVAYAGYCFTGRAWLPGTDVQDMLVFGRDATAYGMALVGLALFLHSHCFWGNVFQLSVIATVGKIVGLLGFVGSLGYLLVRLGIYGL